MKPKKSSQEDKSFVPQKDENGGILFYWAINPLYFDNPENYENGKIREPSNKEMIENDPIAHPALTFMTKEEFVWFDDCFDDPEIQNDFWDELRQRLPIYRDKVLDAGKGVILKNGGMYASPEDLRGAVSFVVCKVARRSFEEEKGIYTGVETIADAVSEAYKLRLKMVSIELQSYLYPHGSLEPEKRLAADLQRDWIRTGFYGELEDVVFKALWPGDHELISERITELIAETLEMCEAIDSDGNWIHGGSKKYIARALYQALIAKEYFVNAKALSRHLFVAHNLKVSEKTIRNGRSTLSGKAKDNKAKRDLLAIMEKITS